MFIPVSYKSHLVAVNPVMDQSGGSCGSAQIHLVHLDSRLLLPCGAIWPLLYKSTFTLPNKINTKTARRYLCLNTVHWPIMNPWLFIKNRTILLHLFLEVIGKKQHSDATLFNFVFKNVREIYGVEIFSSKLQGFFNLSC